MPDNQFNLDEILSQLMAMTVVVVMMKAAMRSSESAKLPPGYVPVKRNTPVMKDIPKASHSIKTASKPIDIPELKGRALQSVRPGWMIKEVLLKEQPLYTGE